MKFINSKFWDRIIFFSYTLLFFLVPLILSPWNYELFEFNKMVLVYLGTAIIVWAWIGKMIVDRRIIFRRTLWDIPLLIFLASQIISTIISIDRHTSFFGYYSRFHGGLFSTISYLLLYWGLVSNIKKEQGEKLIKTILISGLLVSFYGIAEHFGIDKHLWVQDVQRRVFSTLGQPNWLAAYLNILIFVVLVRLTKKDSLLSKSKLLTGSFFIFYLCLLYTKSRSGLIGFIIPAVIFFALNFYSSIRSKAKEQIKKLSLILAITLILPILAGFPVNIIKRIRAQSEKPQLLITPSTDIRKIVWRGAINLWKQYPLFGTGVETFAYSYYWTRPIEHNLTSEWDFLYNKAHNEYLNFLATTGTIGLAAYLLLPLSLFFFSFKKNKKLFISLIYPLGSIIITNIFGFSVVITGLLFFLLPGLEIVNHQPSPKENKKGKDIYDLSPDKVIFTTLIFSFVVFKIFSYWLADYYFAQGRKYREIDYLETAETYLNRAIKLNSSEPVFYSERATILAKLVATLSQNNQTEEAENFVQAAISDSDKTLEISPYHINFYKNRAKVFYYLAFYQIDYLEEGVNTLLEARKLAPSDAKLTYNLGLMYQTLDEEEQANYFLETTLELKPNYEAARKALEKVN